jgi:polygalacturonase
VTILGKRDGIDVDSCRNVRIEGCHIETGDDAISLKSGRGLNGARLGKAAEDVLISHCDLRCRVFACLGIGSETSGGIRNVRIEHCKLAAPRSYAVYIKTRIGRAGVIENILGDDLDISEGNFLRINLTSAGNSNTADDPVEGLLGYPEGRNFSFTNIRVNGGTLVEASRISGEKPLAGFTLEDVTGVCVTGISLQHINQAVLRNINVTGFTGPLLATNAVTGAGLDGAVPYIASARQGVNH